MYKRQNKIGKLSNGRAIEMDHLRKDDRKVGLLCGPQGEYATRQKIKRKERQSYSMFFSF